MPQNIKKRVKNKKHYYDAMVLILILIFVILGFKLIAYFFSNYHLNLSPQYLSSPRPTGVYTTISSPTPSPTAGGEAGSASPSPTASCVYDAVRKICLGTCPKKGECCDPEKDYRDCSIKPSCECHKPCSDDKDCLICTVASEALGQGDACQKAVAQVILNRKGNPAYGATVCAVVKQRNQFSGVRDCSKCEEEPRDIYCKCCRNREFTGANQRAMANICRIESGIETGTDPAPALKTAGATHFNNAGMNSWASRNCQKVNYPACPTFDFYRC